MGRVPGLKPKKSQGPFYASRCILARPARSFPGGYYAETRANEELVRSLQRLTERLALSSPEAMQRAEDLVYSVEMEDRSGRCHGRRNGAHRRTSSLLVTAVVLRRIVRAARRFPIILGKSDGSKSQQLATIPCYRGDDPYQTGRGKAA
jgi:hypothetical protein